MICDTDEVSNQIYHRIEDEFLVVVKSNPLSENVQKSQIENEIENEIEKLINLRHPCIAGPIGFVVPIESDSPQELKIVWWTSTVKSK
jgi:hypothetical protein